VKTIIIIVLAIGVVGLAHGWFTKDDAVNKTHKLIDRVTDGPTTTGGVKK